MVELTFNAFRKLAAMTALLGMFIFASCGDDDDDVNCNTVVIEISDILEDMTDALEAEDCTAIESTYGEFIVLLRNGKSCSFVQSIVADDGFDDVEELIDALEAERDSILADLEC